MVKEGLPPSLLGMCFILQILGVAIKSCANSLWNRTKLPKLRNWKLGPNGGNWRGNWGQYPKLGEIGDSIHIYQTITEIGNWGQTKLGTVYIFT